MSIEEVVGVYLSISPFPKLNKQCSGSQDFVCLHPYFAQCTYFASADDTFE